MANVWSWLAKNVLVALSKTFLANSGYFKHNMKKTCNYEGPLDIRDSLKIAL